MLAQSTELPQRYSTGMGSFKLVPLVRRAHSMNLKCSAQCCMMDNVDGIDGGLGDDEHGESDYGQIHTELQAKSWNK
jgi:hypothetical protein